MESIGINGVWREVNVTRVWTNVNFKKHIWTIGPYLRVSLVMARVKLSRKTIL